MVLIWENSLNSYNFVTKYKESLFSFFMSRRSNSLFLLFINKMCQLNENFEFLDLHIICLDYIDLKLSKNTSFLFHICQNVIIAFYVTPIKLSVLDRHDKVQHLIISIFTKVLSIDIMRKIIINHI